MASLPADTVRAQFTIVRSAQTPSAAKHAHRYHCNHCVAYSQRHGLAPPPTFAGRVDTFRRHLSVCRYAPRELLEPRQVPPPPVQRPTQQPASARGLFGTLQSHRQQAPSQPAMAADEVSKMQEMMLEMVVSTGMPFEAATALGALMSKYNPSITSGLPTTEDLGGRILNEQAAKSDKKLRKALKDVQAETGGRVNLLGDSRISIARRHAIGCLLSLFGCDVAEPFKRSDYHTGADIACPLDDSLRRAIADGWRVGAVVTERFKVFAQARRMLTLRWPKMAFLPCLAYDINSLFKIFVDGPLRDAVEKALDAVDTLHESEHQYLEKVVQAMKRTYGRSYKIFWTWEESWCSLQTTLASLLRARSNEAWWHSTSSTKLKPTSRKC